MHATGLLPRFPLVARGRCRGLKGLSCGLWRTRLYTGLHQPECSAAW
jgi:hypothetical protein